MRGAGREIKRLVPHRTADLNIETDANECPLKQRKKEKIMSNDKRKKTKIIAHTSLICYVFIGLSNLPVILTHHIGGETTCWRPRDPDVRPRRWTIV